MNNLIINEIEAIDEVVNESKIDQLMTIASIYDKQFTIIEEYQYRNKSDISGFKIFQESFYQEGEILDKATGKGKDEGMLAKIVAFIPRLVGAIIDSIKKMFNKQSMKTAEQCSKELQADKSKSKAKTVLSILAAGGLGVASKTAYDKITGTKNENDDSTTNQQNEALEKDKAALEKDKAELVKKITEFEAKIDKDDSQLTLKNQVIENLQKQLADKEDLVVDIEKFKKELGKAKKELGKANDKNSRLIGNIRNLAASKTALKTRLDEANANLDRFNQSLGDYISSADTLYKKFIGSINISETAREQFKHTTKLEEQHKTVMALYALLQQKLDETEKALEDSEKSNAIKENKIKELENAREKLDKSLGEAKAEFDKVSSENKMVLEKNKEINTNFKILQENVVKMAIENKKLKEINSQAMAAILNKNEEITNLKEENSSSKAEVSKLTEQLADKEKQLADINKQIQKVQEDINKQENEEINTLKDKLKDLDSEKQKLENSVKEYKRRIDLNNDKWEKVNNDNKQLQGQLGTANEQIKQAQKQAEDDVKTAQKDAADKIANAERMTKDAETREKNKDAALTKQAADFEQEKEKLLHEIDNLSRNSSAWRSAYYAQSRINEEITKGQTQTKEPTQTKEQTGEPTKEETSTESAKEVIPVKDFMNALKTSVHNKQLALAAIRTLKGSVITADTGQDNQSSKKEAITNIKKIAEQSNKQTSVIISNLEKLDKTGRQISGNYKSALSKERKKNGNNSSDLLFYFRPSDNNDGSIDMVSKIDLSILIENLNKVKASINVIKNKKNYDKIINDNKDKYELKNNKPLNRDNQMIYTISSVDGFNRLRDDFKQIINESQSVIDDIKSITENVNETDNEEIARMHKIQNYISAYSTSIACICEHLDGAMRAYSEACKCVSKNKKGRSK